MYKQQSFHLSHFITSRVYVLKFLGLPPPSALVLVIHALDFGGPNLDVEIRNELPETSASDLAT
jgi:hypothetical protein